MRLARLSLLLACAAAACAREAAPPPTAEILDSAGVRVVLNPPPESAPLWPVGEEPLVEIGGDLSGDPSQALFQVRGAVRLSDGTIVIANAGSHELRWYDPGGLHLRTVGGLGDGPTEFRELALVGVLPGDSVMVNDIRRRRSVVYDRAGQRGRVFLMSSEFGAFPAPAGVLDDGSVLLNLIAPTAETPKPHADDLRYHWPAVVAGPDGIERREFGDYPGTESMCDPSPVGPGCRASVGVLFGRHLLQAAAADRIAIANSDSFSVRIYDGRGALQQVVRQRHTPKPVEEGDFADARSEVMEGMPPRVRAMFTTLFEQMPRHATYPAFESIRLDRTGELWVESSRHPDDRRPVWQVFDRDGLLIGRVEAPLGLAITDSGADYILGVTKDEQDVERVRLYRLERPAARRSPPP